MNEITLSVTELNEYVRDLFSGDELLSRLSLRGEISNFKRHSSGHLYFSLKDAGAVVRCVMFRQHTYGLKLAPRDGLAVALRGYVSVYVRDGQYQFYCEEMRPNGVGALYALFEQTKNRLAQEGLFDEARKKPLPAAPRVLGVVTSPTGAVLRDIVKVARRRDPSVDVLLYPVKVQGDGAAKEIAEGLRALDKAGVDVILCGRGGGSIEDLWAFNEETVARAIAACHAPVVSAVGHQTDFTIADFVADVRAATPSHAAELAVPNRAEAAQRLDLIHQRLAPAALRALRRKQERVEALSAAFSAPRLTNRMALWQKELDTAGQRFHRATEAALALREQAVTHAAQRLDALAPQRVLQRGYALVRVGHRIVSDASALQPGQKVRLEMRDAPVSARVLGEERAEQLSLFQED